MHDCRAIEERLVGLLYGELGGTELRETEAALRVCEGCRASYEQLAASRSLVRALPTEAPSDAGVAELLAAAGRAAERARVARRPRRRAWAWAAAASLVPVAGFAVAVFVVRELSPRQLPIEADKHAEKISRTESGQPREEPPAPLFGVEGPAQEATPAQEMAAPATPGAQAAKPTRAKEAPADADIGARAARGPRSVGILNRDAEMKVRDAGPGGARPAPLMSKAAKARTDTASDLHIDAERPAPTASEAERPSPSASMEAAKAARPMESYGPTVPPPPPETPRAPDIAPPAPSHLESLHETARAKRAYSDDTAPSAATGHAKKMAPSVAPSAGDAKEKTPPAAPETVDVDEAAPSAAPSAATGAAKKVAPSAASLFAEARQLEDSGDREGALAALRRLDGLWPTDPVYAPKGLLRQVELLHAMGRVGEAVKTRSVLKKRFPEALAPTVQ